MMSSYGLHLVALFTLTVPCLEATYEVNEPFNLRAFKNYGSVHFTSFVIPEATGFSLWTFLLLSNKERNNSNCEAAKASVYLQLGGLPVFTPHNETFPPRFKSSHSYFRKTTVSTDISSMVQVPLVAPPPGRWFVASYLQPSSEPAQIRPPGLGSASCSHYIRISVSHHAAKYPKDEPFPIGTPRDLIVEEEDSILRYFISKRVYRYNITVKDCKVLRPPGANCKFAIVSNGIRLPPRANGDHSMLCDWTNESDCRLTVDQPTVNHWHYAAVVTGNKTLTLELTLQIDTDQCSSDALIGPCSVEEYYTDTIPNAPYTADFVQQSRGHEKIIVRDDKPYFASFDIEALVHSGGTLEYRLIFVQPKSYQHAVIYSCVSRGYLTTNLSDIRACAVIQNLTLDYSPGLQSIYYIPYPQSGTWYINVIARCYNSSLHTENAVVDCKGTLYVYTNVALRPCINKQCGEYGTCYTYYSNVIHWSVCKCKAGYRGYGCTDATEAISDGMQLLQTLLLTLSNLLFAAAGIWALYRKWFSEALIYFFVLFASSFYHACDNGTIYTLCVMKYGVLQYCDFYGSIMAVWMTAMAMSEIPDKLRSVLHIAGVLGILIGTQISLSGLWNFVVPILIAAVILATSWVRLCKTERSCFPKLKIWVQQLLPGIACALTGLGLYSFVETDDNYFYVHSIWHLLMATSIILLLPRDNTLECTAVKHWFCALRNKKRRNTEEDQVAVVGDNHTALIETDTSEASAGGSAE